jgi:PPE-repeat protein
MSMAATTMASSFVATQTAMVHPSVVTANRAQLAHLIATNVFGVNFPAIAATEAQYTQMWADNTTAMLGYHATSLQTMAMPTFTPASPMTTPTATAAQTAAVTAAAAPAQTGFFDNPFIQTVNGYLQNVAGGVVGSGVFNPQSFVGLFTGGHDYFPGQYPDVLAPTPRNLAIAYNLTGPEAVGGAPNSYAPPAVAASATASLGRGMYVGNLVVPPSAVTSPIQLAAAEAPLVATAADGAPLMPMFIPPMPPGARKAQRDKPDEKGYGPPIFGTIMRRPPSGG